MAKKRDTLAQQEPGSTPVKRTRTRQKPYKKSTEKATRLQETGNLRIVATCTSVPFPGVPLPYSPDWDDQIPWLEEAMVSETPVCLVPVKEPNGLPGVDNLSIIGVVMKVLKVINLPDDKKNIFLLGAERVSISDLRQVSKSCFEGTVESRPDFLKPRDNAKFELTIKMVEEGYDYIKSYIDEMSRVQIAAPNELKADKLTYLNFMIITAPFDYEQRMKMLANPDLLQRAEMAFVALEKIKEQIELRKEIFARTASEIEREQRDHFLRAQIKNMQNEIGEGDLNDLETLQERADAKKWPEWAKAHFEKELRKLSRFPSNSPDYAMQYNYLDVMLGLPWDNLSEDAIDLAKLETDLDREHYGMKKIKERIVEHIAVLKLRGDMRSPILCLYGPPGVGKTSLCRSIADSISKEYARISLGGLHDETQLRGHRRTYVGALPGRIIAALGGCRTNNPVFVLDEIDKIGNDHRGDPSQALLEILDPEQNSKFHDNYLDVDYDLSKVFFIATANSIQGISAPLLDRMELIDISGYLAEEKVEIAKRHLIPKQLENHGFKANEIKFTDEAINFIIESYTRESGVRKLEKTIARILRKIAVNKAKGEKYNKRIGLKQAKELLGKEDVIRETYTGPLPAGVMVGLAWTQVGGEILYIEASLSKGKGVLTLTGNLGDVMKESATIALQWVKAHAEELGIDGERFAQTDIHIHVPEGAVPKDGPSAGITMTCAIAGAFTERRAKEKTAMTGEATLSGRVLPVGGIKEKILAAKRAGISDIILSQKNKVDIEEIEPQYIEGLTFHYADNMLEVVNMALDKE